MAKATAAALLLALAAHRHDFAAEAPGAPPKGLQFARTGEGRPGVWLVREDEGRKVLVQTDADDTDHRYPIALSGPPLQDLRLSVRCKMLAGKVDQGCGIVWRLADEDNYYLARANALEDNVRIYKVQGGERRQLGSWSGKVRSLVWHELAVVARGDNFVVHFDGVPVLKERDQTFPGAGKWGVWTKADSVIAFADLVATPEAP